MFARHRVSLEPETFPDDHRKKTIFSWLRDLKSIESAADTAETSDLRLVSFVHGFHERVLVFHVDAWRIANFTRNAIREVAPGVCRNWRDPDRGPTLLLLVSS